MRRLLTCLFFLSFFAIPLYAARYEAVSYSLSLNGKVLTLENPIKRSENNVFYLPLSDIVSSIDGDLVYLRKADTYSFTIKKRNIHATLIPFSTEVIINEKHETLSDKIRVIEGDLHVPPEFFSYIGFSCSVSNNRVAINQTKYVAPPVVPVVMSRGTLPKLRPPSPLFITLFGKKYDVSKDFFYQEDHLYLNLIPILKTAGFTISESPEKVEITFEGKTHTFRNGRKKDIISNRGTTLINFESVMKELSMDYLWVDDTKDILVVVKIDDIKYVSVGPYKILKLFSKYPLSYTKPTPLYYDGGYYFDFPSTSSGCGTTLIKSANRLFPDYQLTQINPTTLRLSLLMPHNTFLPFLSSSSEGIDISFNSILSAIEEVATQNGVLVTLRSTFPLAPVIRHLKSENKLILDIDNSYSRLPQKTASASDFFTRIRTSQYSYTPLSSRIVFELSDNPSEISTKQNGSDFQLFFRTALPSTKSEIVSAPEPIKKRDQVLSIRKSIPSVVTDKIIIVDAGHGGRDPGAIVMSYQEKAYTLDVAKRLQTLLAKNGAFVILTRKEDSTIELGGRTTLANENNADLFISIHFNSHFRSKTKGVESYYYKYSDKKLADAVHQQLTKSLPFQDKGVKRARLYVLRNTDMPAVLIEPGYLTNRHDFSKIRDEEYRQKIADAVYLGIVDYLKERKN